MTILHRYAVVYALDRNLPKLYTDQHIGRRGSMQFLESVRNYKLRSCHPFHKSRGTNQLRASPKHAYLSCCLNVCKLFQHHWRQQPTHLSMSQPITSLLLHLADQSRGRLSSNGMLQIKRSNTSSHPLHQWQCIARHYFYRMHWCIWLSKYSSLDSHSMNWVGFYVPWKHPCLSPLHH